MTFDPDQPCDPSPKRRLCFSRLPVFFLLLAFFLSIAPASAKTFKHRSFPARFGSEFGLGLAGDAVGVITGTQLRRLYYEDESYESDHLAYLGGSLLIAAPFLTATGTYYGGKLTGGDTHYAYPLMGALIGSGLGHLGSATLATERWDPLSMGFLLTLPPLTSSIFYEAFSSNGDYSLLGASFFGLLGGLGLPMISIIALPGEALVPTCILGVLMTPGSVYLGGQFTGGNGSFTTTLKYGGISAAASLVLLPIIGPNEYWAMLAATAFIVTTIVGYEKSNHKKSGKEDETGSQLESAAQPMIFQLLNVPF